MPVSTKLMLYKTCVRSVTLYGFHVWKSSSAVVKDLEFSNEEFWDYAGKNSNDFIYENSKLKRLSIYLCKISENVNLKLSIHENGYMIEALNS